LVIVRSRTARRHVLVAALLVLPLLLVAVGQVSLHQGHGCHFEKDCLACRWAAEGVADASAPFALPRPVDPVAVVEVARPARIADASPEAASSRGPPLA
jgi:hypothetical protein